MKYKELKSRLSIIESRAYNLQSEIQILLSQLAQEENTDKKAKVSRSQKTGVEK